MMKLLWLTLVLSSMIGSIVTENSNDDIPVKLAKRLATASLQILPQSLQNDVAKQSSRWCCEIDVLKHGKSSIGVASYYRTKLSHKVYKACDIGWGTCTDLLQQYKLKVIYGTKFKYFTYKEQCPTKHQICCSGYLLVAGQCMPMPWVKENYKKLLELNLLGAI